MKIYPLLILMLCIPLAAAEQVNDTIIFTTPENITITLEINADVHVPLITNNTIPLCEEIIEPEDNCTAMNITDLPLTSNSGEKLSFGFSPWKTEDTVTYWIEDIQGNTLKEEYTTTSKTKKSYTPKTTGKETSIIFKAERERAGCNKSSASARVIILGEEKEEECEENICEEIVLEESFSSLYVRAKNYQENITLYGYCEQEGSYLLFGEETVKEIQLEKGSFSLDIHPRKGENTYGLVLKTGGIPRTITFSLIYEEEEKIIDTEENDFLSEENATLTIPASIITGNTIIENDTKNNTSIIAGLSGLAGAGLLITSIKTKLLRRKHDSA